MVEVFKTNVRTRAQAAHIVAEIAALSDDYQANFDLDDRDCILRVVSLAGFIDPALIIHRLNISGFHAEVLEDTPVSDFNTWLNGAIEDIGLRSDFM